MTGVGVTLPAGDGKAGDVTVSHGRMAQIRVKAAIQVPHVWLGWRELQVCLQAAHPCRIAVQCVCSACSKAIAQNVVISLHVG